MKIGVEKNLFLLGLFAFLLFSIGAVTTTIIPPLVNEEMWSAGTNIVHNYTAQELRGIEIYKREGCVYCHTQQIRNKDATLPLEIWLCTRDLIGGVIGEGPGGRLCQVSRKSNTVKQ